MKTIIRVKPFSIEFEGAEKEAVRAGIWIVTVSQGDRTVVARRCFSAVDAHNAAFQIAKNFDNVVVKTLPALKKEFV